MRTSCPWCGRAPNTQEEIHDTGPLAFCFICGGAYETEREEEDDMVMEKYGVSQAQVTELIKLGVCSTPAEARNLVGDGSAPAKIKEAQALRDSVEALIHNMDVASQEDG